MKNILLTGFQPFGGLTDNPSARIVYVMDGAVINGHQVVARTLPVTFKDAPVCLEQLMETYQPELVLCLGLAVGEEAIRLEQQALNQVDFRIADNAGQKIKGCVLEGGPESYQSNLPLESIRETLHRHNIPARLSNSAGNFVCNALMYTALNLCSRADGHTACGFIHLPCLPQQVAEINVSPSASVGMDGTGDISLSSTSAPLSEGLSMPLARQIESVRLAIMVSLETKFV